MLKRNFWILAAGIAILAGCKKEPASQSNGRLRLDPYEFVVEGDSAATMKLIISCDGEWQVHPDNDWITVSPDSGSGNSEVTVTIAQNNDDDEEDRTGEITVNSGKKRTRATVTQGKRLNIIVKDNTGTESDRISVSDYIIGDETSFSVKSVQAFTIESNATWFTLSPRGGGAGSTVRITLNAVANSQTSAREDKLFIKTATRTKEVTVRQNYNSSLLNRFFGYSDAMNSVSLSDRGGARFLRWFAGGSVSWTVTASDSWLHVDKTSGMGQQLLNVSADPNTTGGVRTGTLTFNSVPAGKTQTVTVRQNWDSNAHSVDPNLSITTSSDYWQDGEVLVFKKHTIGKGIPVVIAGDGFDREALRKGNDFRNGGGWWEETATVAARTFFANEVICDMKEYFDVLILMSESPEFSVNYPGRSNYAPTVTRFDTYGAGENTGAVITAAINAASRMYKVWRDNGEPVHTDADIKSRSGTCSWGPGGNRNWGGDGGGLVRVMFFANGPYPGNASNPLSRGAINEADHGYWTIHEFTGHSFLDLPDMYGVGSGYEPTDVLKADIDEKHSRGFNWWVDYRPREQVIWKDFLPGGSKSDPAYIAEGIGYYATSMQGHIFGRSLWGPNERTCMREGGYMNYDFGSRYQAWNTILLRSGQMADYNDIDKFRTFDLARTKGGGPYVERTWKEYDGRTLSQTRNGDYETFWNLLWPTY
ncbi:MAG: BACON domain-containing protein [Rikenellaceae bacterium]|jgi:hypothetical protein|nr:BACON domain-containing protein [Rikenellaceae bacterium]